jgi:GT2 family glycosyltransferase
MIEIVSATRLSESDFWNKSALGISLQRLKYDKRLVAHLAFENRLGLPEIYNARITAKNNNDILVFIHDDVWLDDYFLADRVIAGLRAYDVIGIAGNQRRVPRQAAWGFLDTRLNADCWDSPNLRGSIAQGKSPFGDVWYFGATPAECELLDGVFLAAKKSVLTTNNVLFDPRFNFHFYDMDFCRSARQHGLRLGTWPICMTHQSIGAFGTAQWNENYRAYIEKWVD